ncbi:MAG: hypothetical protein KJ914_01035 [Gammaproteobacteria bacterium]|nr:hypothetical protein [Gammaproteobacteria bacterium]MBU1724225.1 hypothetical protein [Gammaproteobacteria bacterium]MBU2007177.1 hypothetical protein [Gammaproteobacteria bacterium]
MNMKKLTLACAIALLSTPAAALDLKAFQEQTRAVVPTDPFKATPVCMLDEVSDADSGGGCSFFNNTGMLDATVHLNIGVGKESPEDAEEGDGNPANTDSTPTEVEGWKGLLASKREPEDGFIGKMLMLTHPHGDYQLVLAAGWQPGSKDALSDDTLKAMAGKLAKVYTDQPGLLDGTDTQESMGGIVGSCLLKNGWCQEFADVQGLNLSATIKSVGEGCNAGGGKWSDQPCSHKGMGGACRTDETIVHGKYRMSVWYPTTFELLPLMKQGCGDWITP